MSLRPLKPKLDAPPIIEVMCGFFFAPIPTLDPVVVGGWWSQIKADYPKHAIHPAVIDAPGVVVMQGAGPLRSWLISEDDAWVMQVQPDRFYVNWRLRREQEYPRFSGSAGVRQRAMRELSRLRAYCSAELGASIVPIAVELAKVDLIVEGPHWDSPEALGSVLPVIADIRRVARAPDVELGLNFIEPRPDGRIQVSLSLATETLFDGACARAVKIDTRGMRTLPSAAGDDVVEAAFAALNDDLNDVFFGLINEAELTRFSNRKGAA
jgi:uncharacterized protein (TIGR04255 family)